MTRILFVAQSHYLWHAEIIEKFAAKGAVCGLISPPGIVIPHSSKLIECRYNLLPHMGVSAGVISLPFVLERVCDDFCPDILMPMDDLSSWQLMGLHASNRVSQATRFLIEKSLGDPWSYPILRNRRKFTAFAKSQRIATPVSFEANTLERAVASIRKYPVMVKRNQTTGGYGVAKADNERELYSIYNARPFYARVKNWARRQVGMACLLMDREPEPIEIQGFIPGKLGMRVVAALDGKILSAASFIGHGLSDETNKFSSSKTREPLTNYSMAKAVKTAVDSLGLSGFLCFDFIVEDHTNPSSEAWMIECNPRMTHAVCTAFDYGRDMFGPLLSKREERVAA